MKCRFGPVAVPALFHHRGAVTCIAPPALALCHWDMPSGTLAGKYGREAMAYPHNFEPNCWGARLPTNAVVEVSFNGVDFTVGSVGLFTWFDLSQVQLNSIQPSAGPTGGGTRVTIHGASFIDHGGGIHGPRCQFGATASSPVTRATLLSATRLICFSPPHPLGSRTLQHVQVTLNGYADTRTLVGHLFHHLASTGVENATAEHAGNASHGVSPAEGGLDDGAGDGQTSTQLTFRYDPEQPTLSAVAPLGGPLAGGSRLTVTAASALTRDGAPLCLFGSHPAYAVPASIPAGSSSIANTLTCISPPAALLTASGLKPPGAWCLSFGGSTIGCSDPAYATDGALAVPLAVSLNGNASDSSPVALPWLYYSVPPTLDYSLPIGGPVAGGTPMRIVGRGLLDYGGVLCMFGQPHGLGAVRVRATVAGGVHVDALEGSALLTRVAVHHLRQVPTVEVQAARSVLCHTPPLSANDTDGDSALIMRSPWALSVLSISVDGGQHFSGNSTLDFLYVCSPTPCSPPALLHLPTCITLGPRTRSDS